MIYVLYIYLYFSCLVDSLHMVVIKDGKKPFLKCCISCQNLSLIGADIFEFLKRKQNIFIKINILIQHQKRLFKKLYIKG